MKFKSKNLILKTLGILGYISAIVTMIFAVYLAINHWSLISQAAKLILMLLLIFLIVSLYTFIDSLKVKNKITKIGIKLLSCFLLIIAIAVPITFMNIFM